MLRSISILLLAVAMSAAAFASEPTYDAIRAARLDGRSVAVHDLTIKRDAFTFTFGSGAFYLLAPVNGKTFGAVFVGQGSFELRPNGEQERRHLALVNDDDAMEVLRDDLQSLVLYSVSAAKEIEAHGKATQGTAPAAASDALERAIKQQKKDYTTNFDLRPLHDLIDGAAAGGSSLIAVLDSKKLPDAVVIFDPLGVETSRIGTMMGGEESMLVVKGERGGYWYSAHRFGEKQDEAHPRFGDASSYTIDTTIGGDESITGTTTMVFTPLLPVRVLPINLTPRLRVTEASYSSDGGVSWKAATYVQEKFDEDADLAIVLPEAMQPGKSAQLKVSYNGKKVLEEAGDGNYFVGARESWYPNLGAFTDVATYDLTYRIPKKREIVSVGVMSSDQMEGEQRVMKFKAATPIRVAGFNYGKFKKLNRSDKDSGFEVTVYTNPGTPAIVNQINRYLEDAEHGGVVINTDQLADSAMVDGLNAARVSHAFFGALDDQSINITQQSNWGFGQSWPSLIYLPYLAFVNSNIRVQLGIGLSDGTIEQVGYHEFAHQWWGHQVGWASYRDQWLSEGFAEFTAGLVVQQISGWPAYNDHMERIRRTILEKPRLALLANYAAGPISDGSRVNTWRNQSAYNTVIYEKGAYVLHMLRMMMNEPGQGGDAKFIAMMSDFVKSYSGKNPSTRDFQTVVEKHMTQVMNAAGNGKMDWFFHQWVDGTDMPKYASSIAATQNADGSYHIEGSATQSGVSNDFRVMMPIYIEFDGGGLAKFGFMPLAGNSTQTIKTDLKLPKKPKKISINAMHDILAF